MHACDGQTDGQTDIILLAIPRLHYMQRVKNGSRLGAPKKKLRAAEFVATYDSRVATARISKFDAVYNGPCSKVSPENGQIASR